MRKILLKILKFAQLSYYFDQHCMHIISLIISYFSLLLTSLTICTYLIQALLNCVGYLLVHLHLSFTQLNTLFVAPRLPKGVSQNI